MVLFIPETVPEPAIEDGITKVSRYHGCGDTNKKGLTARKDGLYLKRRIHDSHATRISKLSLCSCLLCSSDRQTESAMTISTINDGRIHPYGRTSRRVRDSLLLMKPGCAGDRGFAPHGDTSKSFSFSQETGQVFSSEMPFYSKV